MTRKPEFTGEKTGASDVESSMAKFPKGWRSGPASQRANQSAPFADW